MLQYEQTSSTMARTYYNGMVGCKEKIKWIKHQTDIFPDCLTLMLKVYIAASAKPMKVFAWKAFVTKSKGL